MPNSKSRERSFGNLTIDEVVEQSTCGGAVELTFAMGRASRPKWIALRLFHKLHVIVANISGLSSSPTCINLLSKSQKFRGGGDIMDWNHWWGSHTGAIWLQKHSAWRASSESTLHSSHTSDSTMSSLQVAFCG